MGDWITLLGFVRWVWLISPESQFCADSYSDNGSFLADEDWGEGRWSILARSLVAVETYKHTYKLKRLNKQSRPHTRILKKQTQREIKRKRYTTGVVTDVRSPTFYICITLNKYTHVNTMWKEYEEYFSYCLAQTATNRAISTEIRHIPC